MTASRQGGPWRALSTAVVDAVTSIRNIVHHRSEAIQGRWTSHALGKAVGITTMARLITLLAYVVTALAWPDGGFYFVLVIALAAACMDPAALITVRNIIVVYHFLVLGVGPYVVAVSDAGRVHRFAAMLFAAFLVGGLAHRALRRTREQGPAVKPPRRPSGHLAERRGSLLLIAGIAMQVMLVGMAMREYGFAGFISGESLSGNISAFAEAGGLTNYQILNAAGYVVTASLVAAYAQLNAHLRRFHWVLLIVLLIGMPLVSFERADLVKHTLVLLFLYGYTGLARRKAARPVVVLLVSLGIALAAALGIGLLRSGNLDAEQHRSDQLEVILKSELTPVYAIDFGLEPGAPRFGGSSIYEPLVERFIPRRLFPDKAPNTAALYMELTDPEALDAGYSLAITGVGTILLNYGVWGTYLAALVVGFLVGSTRPARPERVGYHIVIYFMLYDLMRTDLVFSLSQLFVGVVGYRILLWLYTQGTDRWSRRRSAIGAAADAPTVAQAP